jgi:hypothetical protein
MVSPTRRFSGLKIPLQDSDPGKVVRIQSTSFIKYVASIVGRLFILILNNVYPQTRTDHLVPYGAPSGELLADAANREPWAECSPYTDLAVYLPEEENHSAEQPVTGRSSCELSRPASTASPHYLELTLPVVDLNFCDLLPYEGI